MLGLPSASSVVWSRLSVLIFIPSSRLSVYSTRYCDYNDNDINLNGLIPEHRSILSILPSIIHMASIFPFPYVAALTPFDTSHEESFVRRRFVAHANRKHSWDWWSPCQKYIFLEKPTLLINLFRENFVIPCPCWPYVCRDRLHFILFARKNRK